MLRVGVPPASSPWSFDCFESNNDGNGTTLRFLFEKKLCREAPGFSLELCLLVLKLLGYPTLEDVTFVSADGWSSMQNGRGLMDLLVKDEIDLTIPNLSITYDRQKVVNFTNLVYLSPKSAYCFLICGTDELLKLQPWGIVEKLVPTGYLVVCLLVTMFALCIARFVQRKVRNRPLSPFHSFLNVVLVRTNDRGTVGLVHNYFVSTVLFLVYFNGMFAGTLIETFAPKREYPFRTIQQVAEGVSSREWTMTTAEGSHSFVSLTQLDEIKHAVKRNPIVMFAFPLTPAKYRPGDILYIDTIEIYDFMKTYRNTMDCMCQVDSNASTNLISFGTQKSKPPFLTQSVTRVVNMLWENGLIRRLDRKYMSGADEESILSTQDILESGLSGRSIFVSVSFTVFYVPFLLYCAVLTFAFCVFLMEVAKPTNFNGGSYNVA